MFSTVDQILGSVCFIALYVDDNILVCNDTDLLTSIKKQLVSTFEMTDLGNIRSCLGFNIQRDRSKGWMHLSHTNAILETVDKFGLSQCKVVASPMVVSPKSLHLSKLHCPQIAQEQDAMKDIPYASLVGALQYFAHASRPYISFATNLLGQFMSSPGKEHWIAAKHVLRYLKGTTNYGLLYCKEDGEQGVMSLTGYTDADWASSDHLMRSKSGNYFTSGSSLVS